MASPPPMHRLAIPRRPPVRLERIEQGDEDSRSAAADRMTKGDGPAVDVDLLGRNAELALGDHRHDGEGLVDLEEIDLLDRPVDLLEQQRGWPRRGGREPLGLLAPGGRTLDDGDRLELRRCGIAREMPPGARRHRR